MPEKGDASKKWRKLLLRAAVAVDLFPLGDAVVVSVKQKDRELSYPYVLHMYRTVSSACQPASSLWLAYW
jgi:hypothetical protein